MRVLLLNQYFPPDTSATATMAGEVVRALADAGHDVRVVAGRPSYGTAVRSAWRWRSVEPGDGCTVVRVGSAAFARTRMSGRIVNYLTYLGLAGMAGRWPADVVLAMTDPPLAALVGLVVARRRRVPLVYNVRDLHPDVALAAGLLRPGPVAWVWERLHRVALRAAARVIVLGDDMRARVVAKGMPAERVVVVRDGARLDGPDDAMRGPLTATIRGDAAFVVVHAGNLGYGGAWDALLGAARRLAGEDVAFAFVGDGAERGRLRRQAADCAAVRWVDPRPAAEVPEVLSAGDLQVVTVRHGLEGLIVPSKLYAVLAAGRPVLAVAPDASDVAGIVRDAGCGWVADPRDPDAVATAVRQAMGDRRELAARGRRARAAAARFDRAALLRQFVDAVEQVR